MFKDEPLILLRGLFFFHHSISWKRGPTVVQIKIRIAASKKEQKKKNLAPTCRTHEGGERQGNEWKGST